MRHFCAVPDKIYKNSGLCFRFLFWPLLHNRDLTASNLNRSGGNYMPNIFLQTSHKHFTWDKLGNIREGRLDLGEDVPVIVYRLLEYSLNHVLAEEFGAERCDGLFRRAGFLAGAEFAKNLLDLNRDMNAFIAELQQALITLKIGILRVEELSGDASDIVLTVAQDLDCSGLPPTDEVVCTFDEGFLSGVLETYTKHPYYVKEVDCWASGDRVCRFRCRSENGS